ncbi:MAG: hypothetical protein ACR2OA_15635 [Rubripirellula sp.]|jgi:hypothetical protein
MTGKNAKRQRRLIAVALVMMGIYAIIGVMGTQSKQKRLDQSARDLDSIYTMLNDINHLKTVPKVAALRLDSPAEVTNRISAARSTAGLPESTLLREEPTAPQRIDRSDFELRSTTIDLAPASLTQIIAFCENLRDEDSGTLVRDLTLTQPRLETQQTGLETWKATLVLTQMFFSPTSPQE